MKRLVSLKEISHEEWLKYRKTGLTGTDAGAIVGLNPYRSAFAVFQDKLSANTEEKDNEAMRQGRDLEAYVAQRFTKETGLKVRKANAIYYNEDHPFMLANFDRMIVGEKAGLECKTVSPYSSDKWENGKIPLHYQMQIQHYLAVSGLECWYLAALIFGTGFLVHKVKRDEEMIRNLITIEERFWKENILGHKIPDPDGSSNYTELLNKLYFGTPKEHQVQLFQVGEDIRRREEIKKLIEKLEKEKKVIEQKIQLQMGAADATYAVADNYSISWTSTVTQRLDSKRLKEEEPEIYQKYLKESNGKRFLVKQIKEKTQAA